MKILYIALTAAAALVGPAVMATAFEVKELA
jgi:hypothetical protein